MQEIIKKISTYEVTDDATADGTIYINTPYLEREYLRLHAKLTAPSIRFAKDLEKDLLRHIEKSPEVAVWYNLLTGLYLRTNKLIEARKINAQAQIKHPDYTFAITHAAEFAVADKDFALAERLLGTELLIEKRFPNRKRFHESEFFAYYHSVMLFLVEQERFSEAENRLIRLRSWSETDDRTKKIAAILISKRMEVSQARMKKVKEKITINEVDSYSLVPYEQTNKRTSLILPSLEILYHTDPKKISEQQLSELIALPRTELIKDCQNILLDSIRRYDEFQNIDFDPDIYGFYIHSLKFLGALKAEESLEVVFDCLKQGAEFLDFWYADDLEDTFNPTLYAIGQNQLEKLADFVKTPHIYGWAKCLMIDVVEQVALTQPDRRAEVLSWAENIVNYFVENEHQEGLLDYIVTTQLVGFFMKLRAEDKSHHISLFNQKGWIDEMMIGDLNLILKEISYELDPYDIEPQPEDIFEYYNLKYKDRKLKTNNRNYLESIPSDELDNLDFIVKMMTEKMIVKDDDYDDYEDIPTNSKQIKQLAAKIAEPMIKKVGRNEPCPCGSGKKYKKCHGG
jgi:SEC-C motif